jgi:hypothetical protein
LFSKIIAYLLLDIFLERLNNSSNETEHSKKYLKKRLTNETKYDIIYNVVKLLAFAVRGHRPLAVRRTKNRT